VGLVSERALDLGHQVILVDDDPAKLAALRRARFPSLPELLKRHPGHSLTFSDDLPQAVRAGYASLSPPARPDRAGRSGSLLGGVGRPQRFRRYQSCQG
jgi:UDP-glucose 6-dehydrogenase